MTRVQTPPVAESVQVTQVDREAAADLMGWKGVYDWRDRTPIVQAFARHRLASYESGRAEGVRAVTQSVGPIMARMEAIEDEASDALTGLLTEHEAGYHRGEKFTAKSLRRHLHDLIRALSKEPTK